MPPPLLLASASPRRADLLRAAGYAFAIEPADIDEEAYQDQYSPRELGLFLAQMKARDVAARFPNHVVLAADTVVTVNGKSLGKPVDVADARRIMTLLAGRSHEVITGVAVRAGASEWFQAVTSHVAMPTLPPSELDLYLASNRWRGKAGGYGIQDSNPIVACLGGSVTNVMGLPMDETRSLLTLAGVAPVTPDNV